MGGSLQCTEQTRSQTPVWWAMASLAVYLQTVQSGSQGQVADPQLRTSTELGALQLLLVHVGAHLPILYSSGPERFGPDGMAEVVVWVLSVLVLDVAGE